ncbi:hypothetical protein KY290_011233 [Solanum tuberosum]|uniref:Uncharacterized protein n=1 Tax=Solanum tuberosum TaxID=4113 RepID=A0ABQ7W050_SOLTU|nr:hypothetical protein KY284_011304 [Solanum tuberosum]KAH0774096.1 hypothetical protein KY290_011233 [Solanum tuberosum]
MSFSSRNYFVLGEISNNILSHDQQGPPTILPDDETINNNVDTYRVPMRIIHTTAIVPAQPIVNEVDDDEENYSEFSDDDDNDEDDEEDVDVDVSEYSKTRTYHVPTMDISGDEDVIVEEQEACAICLIEYNDEDTVGTLQCPDLEILPFFLEIRQQLADSLKQIKGSRGWRWTLKRKHPTAMSLLAPLLRPEREYSSAAVC